MSNVMSFQAHGLSCVIRREKGCYAFSFVFVRPRGKPLQIKGLAGFVGVDQARKAAEEMAAKVSANLGLTPSREA